MFEQPVENAGSDVARIAIMTALISAAALIIRTYMKTRAEMSLAVRDFSYPLQTQICEDFLIPFLGSTSEIIERGYLLPGESSSIMKMIDLSSEQMKLHPSIEAELQKLRKLLKKSHQNVTFFDRILLTITGLDVQELVNQQTIKTLQKIQNLYNRIYRPIFTEGA